MPIGPPPAEICREVAGHDPGLNLPNATAQVQAVNLPASDKPVDLFWTVQNYHDVANNAGEPALRAFDQAVFKLLKSGGTYVIIDHADTAGRGLANTNTTHRIDPDYVKRRSSRSASASLARARSCATGGRSFEECVRSRHSRADGSVRLQVPQALR